jgi:hypothetical protein
VGGSKELIPSGIWACENDQIPLGRPPAGRHPNTGIGGDGCKGVVADTHKARGQDPSLGLKSVVMCVTGEAQHKAGPCLAFYSPMARFAAVKAKVVLHVVLPFSGSEASSFLEQRSALGGINLHIWGLSSCNFADSGHGVSVVSWGIAWVGKCVPILIKFLSFLN